MNTSQACVAAVALVGLVARWAVGGGRRRWDETGAFAGRRRARLPARRSARPAATGRRRAGPLVLGQPVRPTRPAPRPGASSSTTLATSPPCRPGTTWRTSPAASGSGSTTTASRPRRAPTRPSPRARTWRGTSPRRCSMAPGRPPDRARSPAGPGPAPAGWTDLRPGSSTRSPTSTSSRPVVWPAACGLPPPAPSAPMVSSRACGWSTPSWRRPAWPARMCSSRPRCPPVRSPSPSPRIKASLRPMVPSATGSTPRGTSSPDEPRRRTPARSPSCRSTMSARPSPGCVAGHSNRRPVPSPTRPRRCPSTPLAPTDHRRRSERVAGQRQV